jgi:inner membrane protein
MNRTHTTCGAAAGAWLGVASQAIVGGPAPWLTLAGTGLAALAAFTPDLDHPSAKPVKALGPVGWVLCRALRAISMATTRVAHRGLTHSLLFALVLGGAGFLISLRWLPTAASAYVGLAIFTGVVAALLGDLVTNSGLKHLMWPLRTIVSIPRGLRIGTGGIVELYVVFPVMLVATWVGIGLLLVGGVSV